MNVCRVAKTVIVFSLIFLVAAIPLYAQGAQRGTQARSQTGAQSASSEFMQGKQDGELAAKGSPVYMLLGCGCGIIGFIAALVSSPEPPAEALMGKSEEYVLGFTEGYKSKSRSKNIANACSGWALGVALVLSLSSF